MWLESSYEGLPVALMKNNVENCKETPKTAIPYRIIILQLDITEQISETNSHEADSKETIKSDDLEFQFHIFLYKSNYQPNIMTVDIV